MRGCGFARRGSRWSRHRSGRWRTAIVIVVRGSSCFSDNTEFAVQAVDDFAGEIAIDLEVLDGDVQLLKGVAEVKARGVETSDVVVGEGESAQRESVCCALYGMQKFLTYTVLSIRIT